MAETVRLQVDIPRSKLEELEELQRLGGLRTKRELWDTAFTLLKWALKKKAQGSSIGSMGEEGAYTELEMPFLEHYASSVRHEQAEDKTKKETGVPAMIATASVATPARRNGVSNISTAKRKQRASG